jgi:hypothetical protein
MSEIWHPTYDERFNVKLSPRELLLIASALRSFRFDMKGQAASYLEKDNVGLYESTYNAAQLAGEIRERLMPLLPARKQKLIASGRLPLEVLAYSAQFKGADEPIWPYQVPAL